MSETETDLKETLAFILPLIAFMVIGSFAPNFAEVAELAETDSAISVADEAKKYFACVAIQLLVGFGTLIYFRRYYFKHFPLRVSRLSVIVGVVGVILWIAICHLGIEHWLLSALGWESSSLERPGFNPFAGFDDQIQLTAFLALRFSTLALLVPIAEELFLRGWLMRWVHDPDWEPVVLTKLSTMALLTPCFYGALTHPMEMIAAIVWFGMVTLLMMRTGNFWDCVVAHAVTNLLLGIYIICFSQWQLW